MSPKDKMQFVWWPGMSAQIGVLLKAVAFVLETAYLIMTTQLPECPWQKAVSDVSLEEVR